MNHVFSKRLKVLREQKGLSQGELAEQLGVSRSRIGMWEQGRREPDYESMVMIAEYFGEPVSIFVEENPVSQFGQNYENNGIETRFFEYWKRLSQEEKIEAVRYMDYIFQRKDEK